MGFSGSIVWTTSAASPAAAGTGLDVEDVKAWDRWPEPWRAWLFPGFPTQESKDAWVSLADAWDAPLLAGEIFDSDGVRLTVASHPSGSWESYLVLEGVLGHLYPPYAPFHEDGSWMSPAEQAEQEAEYERELADVRQQVLAEAVMGTEAAHRAVAWARDSGLAHQPVEAVVELFDRNHRHGVFAAEMLVDLMARLGLRATTS